MIFIPTNNSFDGTDFLMIRKTEALRYFVHAMYWLERLYSKSSDFFCLECYNLDMKNVVDLSIRGLDPTQICFQFKRLKTLSAFLQLHALKGIREIYLNKGFQQFYKVYSMIT